MHRELIHGYSLPALEVCEVKYRSVVGILTGLPWAFGTMAWGGVASQVRDWRWLQLYVTLPFILVVPLLLWVVFAAGTNDTRVCNVLGLGCNDSLSMSACVIVAQCYRTFFYSISQTPNTLAYTQTCLPSMQTLSESVETPFRLVSVCHSLDTLLYIFHIYSMQFQIDILIFINYESHQDFFYTKIYWKGA